MDFNIEVRKKQLQSLDQYITSSKDKVQSVLEYLGWNAKKVIEAEVKATCTINPAHKISFKSANEHLEKCYTKTLGYNLDDAFLSEPLHHSTCSIKLDNEKKIEILGQARQGSSRFRSDYYFQLIVHCRYANTWNGHDIDPMTSDRLFSTFSSDERLVLYNYCIKNTDHPAVPSEFNLDVESKKEEKSLTHEELLAKERDAKRRRIKYKSVHTGRNKSHTEVIKEVIENQMDLYRECLVKKQETDSHCKRINWNVNQNTANISGTSINNELVDYSEENNIERPHSSVSHHSASYHNSNKRDHHECRKDSKTDYDRRNKERKKYKDSDKRRSPDHYDSRKSYDDKRSRHRDYDDDYRRHSRDKRDLHYKSQKR